MLKYQHIISYSKTTVQISCLSKYGNKYSAYGMHVQSGCSGNDSDVVIPSLPCSDSQPADSPRF